MDIEKAYREKFDRFSAMLAWEETDRLPFFGNNCTIDALQAITGRDDYVEHPKEVFAEAMRLFDADVIKQFVLPDRQDKHIGPRSAIQGKAGLGYVATRLLHEWRREHGPTDTPEAVRDFCLSLPPADQAGQYASADDAYARWVELHQWGEFLKPVVWIPGHLCGKVPWMWYTAMGYESYLMAHMLYPEAMERLFALCGQEGRIMNQGIARAIREHNMPPVVYYGEDICGNDGPLASPKILHEIYFPHLKVSHEPLLDAGIHTLWHSDGDIMPIVDNILACGIDGFQGFEEDKGMDLYALAEKTTVHGTGPLLCGSVSVSSTFYLTPDDVRKDVERMIDLARQRGGGVVLAPSSSMMENMPTENVLAYYEACRNQNTL